MAVKEKVAPTSTAAKTGATTAKSMIESEGQLAPSYTQLQLIWIRFRRNRLAVFGMAVVLLVTMMAILAPWISPENIYDPLSVNAFAQPDQAPTLNGGLRYLLGTDFQNHSMTAQIIYGARFTLMIGFASAIAGMLVGIIVGSIAGYAGGWADATAMRTVDVFLTLPALPVLLVTAATIGNGHVSPGLMILVFTFFGWAYPARLVRGLFLTLRTQEFVEAARAVGVSNARVIFRHVLPNTLRPILVATTLLVAGNVVFESAIDFLGIGLQYPDTSWGSVLAFAEQDPGGIRAAWWVTMFPGAILALTLMAINFIGDGLSDALDVKMK